MEVLHHLVNCISLFFNGVVVKSGSFKANSHEIYFLLIILIILLCKHDDGRSIKRKSVEKKIIVEIWAIQSSGVCNSLLDTREQFIFHPIPFVYYILIDHLMYGFHVLNVIEYEFAKKNDLSQEGLHIFLIHREGNLHNGFDPFRVYFNISFHNNMAKDITLRYCKIIFLGLRDIPYFSHLSYSNGACAYISSLKIPWHYQGKTLCFARLIHEMWSPWHDEMSHLHWTTQMAFFRMQTFPTSYEKLF